ncbi:MAG: TonB family protein [Prevotellaceae bacterium]|jgi:TonB family protein|nr:TonB family protein [Prevotellaceae bacterium]
MQPDKIKGIIATVIFHGTLLFMLLSWGYQKPFPPPTELGILINFGDMQDGSGVEEPTSAAPAAPRPLPQPATEASEQGALTQDYEEAPAISQPPKKKREKRKRERPLRTSSEQTPQPHPDQQADEALQKPTEKPREVNRNALFPGQGAVGSQGQSSSATSGNQGSPDGSPRSPNTVGSGLGEISGASLAGRSLSGNLPEPDYRIQQSGRVVVRIKVDRDGNVVEAEARQEGSTLMDATLYDAAERAARRAKFSASSSGPLFQNGVITYVFKLGQ